MKPWPKWLTHVEMTAYYLSRPLIGAAFGLGISDAEGVTQWFMLGVGGLWVVDRLLEQTRRALCGPPPRHVETITWEGAIKVSGDDAKALHALIEKAKPKPKPEGLN